jgi:hypothetical protein
MAGLVPAIYVFLTWMQKTWMPGTRPGMTSFTGTPHSIGCVLNQPLRRVRIGATAALFAAALVLADRMG